MAKEGEPVYYNKDGSELTSKQWSVLFDNLSFKRIKKDVLPNGRVVSTVWLGIDYGHDQQPPLIFETMVFPSERSNLDVDVERYSTEEEARAGHARMVEHWSTEQ
jgi:hypothetical protein